MGNINGSNGLGAANQTQTTDSTQQQLNANSNQINQAKTQAAQAKAQLNAYLAAAEGADQFQTTGSQTTASTTVETSPYLGQRPWTDPNTVSAGNIEAGEYGEAREMLNILRKELSLTGKINLELLSKEGKKQLSENFKILEEFSKNFVDVVALASVDAIGADHEIYNPTTDLHTYPEANYTPTVYDSFSSLARGIDRLFDKNSDFIKELQDSLEPEITETELPKLDPGDFHVDPNNLHENWGGLGEKWMKTDSGEWHYMIENEETGETDVYKWDSKTKEGMKNGEDTKIGTLDKDFFYNYGEVPPNKIDNLYVTNEKTYDNWGGLGEKWLKDDSGQWHYIIKNEDTGKTDVYRWDSGTKEGMSNGEDTKIGSTSGVYYDNPQYFGSSQELKEKRNTFKVENQNTHENSFGLGEKWIKNESGEWHYIVENHETSVDDNGEVQIERKAAMYRWDSGSKAGSLAGGDRFMRLLDARYFDDPDLFESDPPSFI